MSRKYYNKHEEKILADIALDEYLSKHKKKKKEKQKKFFAPYDGKETLKACYENRLKLAVKKTKLHNDNIVALPVYNENYNPRNKFPSALSIIVDYRKQWIRRPEDWVCKTHNGSRQFSSLVRHLFAKYPVPIFMDGLWFTDRTDFQNPAQIFIDVAQGQNIRKVESFTFPNFTKRMAHIMMQCDKSYTFEEAVRWAQIKSLGGDKQMFNTLRETSLRKKLFSEHREQYNRKFIQWLVNNPMLDKVHIGPIYDYIAHRYGNRAQYTNQQLFDITGRSAQSLLREIEQWHIDVNQIEQSRKIKASKWEHHSDIKDKTYTLKTLKWEFKQILTASKLREEGRSMRHCVGSYSHSCACGHCAIFSLRCEGAREVTIEVTTDREPYILNQARCHCNGRPNNNHKKLMEKWARDNRIRINQWIF